MRFAASVVTGLLLAQSASTFVPFAGAPTRAFRLFATSEDVVNAYRKSKAAAKVVIPDYESLPEPDSFSAAPSITEIPKSVPEIPSIPEIPDISKTIDTVKASLPSLPDLSSLPKPDAPTMKMANLNEYLGAVQARAGSIATIPREQMDAPPLYEFLRNNKVSGFQKSTFTETTAVPGGKAPSLGEYFEAKVREGDFDVLNDERTQANLANAKANVALLIQNTYDLFGAAREGSVSGEMPNMPALENLPEGSVGWGLAGAGLLLVMGQRNAATKAKTKAVPKAGTKAVPTEAKSLKQLEVDAVSELATNVQLMQAQIQKLTEQTLDLKKELQETQNKLMEKELLISKQRLLVADNDLNANRKATTLEIRLRERDQKIKSLESELQETRGNQPSPAPSKVKDVEEELKKVEIVEPAIAEAITAAMAENAKKTKAKAKGARGNQPSPAPSKVKDVEEELKKVEIVEPAVAEAITAAMAENAKKTKAKAKGAAKKGAVKTVRVTKAKGTSTAKVKKAVTKKVAATASKDFTELSKSTLTRKTVAELKKYLDGQGISTTGGDGKPLKKADLVEAIITL